MFVSFLWRKIIPRCLTTEDPRGLDCCQGASLQELAVACSTLQAHDTTKHAGRIVEWRIGCGGGAHGGYLMLAYVRWDTI